MNFSDLAMITSIFLLGAITYAYRYSFVSSIFLREEQRTEVASGAFLQSDGIEVRRKFVECGGNRLRCFDRTISLYASPARLGRRSPRWNFLMILPSPLAAINPTRVRAASRSSSFSKQYRGEEPDRACKVKTTERSASSVAFEAETADGAGAVARQ